ncbi:cobalt ECF transporter T component CbiQ [uncultured Pseudodesulfovibrio sp.]|uniref:cobalt ECF transporter T component CbiQ n=1 Tax=uncultured Pseudodesulfovibrio sp. TaxID=2035858 RepID=UPI0029C72213|nr:cobalt ECF transporter T component CbiQ [uncultured Pseudodesulfovibrio sp.]
MAFTGEQFAFGDSFIHRLSPPTRLICAALFTIPCALLQGLESASVALIAGILFVFTARLPMRAVLQRLLAVNVFTLFLWFFIPFSTPGIPALTFGPLTATHEGIRLALLITLKTNAIVCAVMTLMGTIPVQDLGPALQQLKMPEKICHILLFTYRYIFVIHQEYTIMRRAMAARGFKPKTDSHTYRSYAWLVGMLLVKSWDRAERVHGAMRCRGFRGRFYTLTTFSTSSNDTLFIFECLTLTTGILCIEFFWKGIL